MFNTSQCELADDECVILVHVCYQIVSGIDMNMVGPRIVSTLYSLDNIDTLLLDAHHRGQWIIWEVNAGMIWSHWIIPIMRG
jgi:hypothetical protein